MMYKIFGSYRFDQLGLTPTQERWRRSATRGPRILLDLISTHFLSRFVLFHLLHKFCLHPGPPPTWRARASWKTEIRNRSELRSTSSAQYQTEKIFLSSQQQSQASGLVAGQNKTVDAIRSIEASVKKFKNSNLFFQRDVIEVSIKKCSDVWDSRKSMDRSSNYLLTCLTEEIR